MKRWAVFAFMAVLVAAGARTGVAQTTAIADTASPPVRERLLMDFGWKFAMGHAFDAKQDFNYATVPFFFAKAGYGDGPASAKFDDRAWRTLNLPHDWAVALPFDARGNDNHGSKAIGRNFPQNDVGWYRKTFTVPATDLGRCIGMDFDGVYRDSVVWINGHYLGTEHSGYSSFHYDLTDYLNYGGTNVIAVRADAMIEEGWFYEGAGIYRHVWLTKTAPLHVAHDGTFVTTQVHGHSSAVAVTATVQNDGLGDADFAVDESVLDAKGLPIANAQGGTAKLKAGDSADVSSLVMVNDPRLWSIEDPYLHTMVTTIRSGGKIVDRYETRFGIRTILFDPNQGFFLNGKHVEIEGTDDHQDHAGVGTAIPDSLQEYRVERLKAMGSNAIRTSHNPPTPELLEICDRLGMLVLDEHRMMGTTPEILDQLKRLVLRDRNHPSVVLWSVGNEEWALEWSATGERLTAAMQAFVHRLDPTRRTTVALSGSGAGNSLATDVFGFNYFLQHHIDEMHAKFPDRPVVGTEESSSTTTRGIYVEDDDRQHLTAYDHNKDPHHASIEEAWNFHSARPFSSGLFYWTGFDYRGETTPFGWPAISSQFGLLDTCGFFKDNAYLVQSWWTAKPTVHLLPHWNWPGREGQDINVRAYSNAAEVELFLNGQSLGRKPMPKNSHLEWMVKYAPGKLIARAYTDGKEVASDTAETTSEPASIQLIPHREKILADGESVSVITVRTNDAQGRLVPTASSEIAFTLEGPGKIIGVGNGDPSSHEADQYVETNSSLPVTDWHRKPADGLDSLNSRADVAASLDDSTWEQATDPAWNAPAPKPPFPAAIVYRGSFFIPELAPATRLTLLLRSLGQEQSVCLNGKPLAKKIKRNKDGYEFKIDPASLVPGKNIVAIVATPLVVTRDEPQQFRWDDTGPAAVRIVTPAGTWKRSLFNGLAQVIVQSTQQPGEIKLNAVSPGLTSAELKVATLRTVLRPQIPAN